jgi:hypothetical protein
VKLKGKLTISRIRKEDGFVMSMKVMDELSRSRFIEVEISPENLVLAITSLADQECEFELRSCDRVGKQHEVKVEYVQGIRPNKKDFIMDFICAVLPFEVDGWKADNQNDYNDHNMTEKGYKVIFHRWVGEGLGYEKAP